MCIFKVIIFTIYFQFSFFFTDFLLLGMLYEIAFWDIAISINWSDWPVSLVKSYKKNNCLIMVLDTLG